ncbi:class I SAM-dependent methyltransferase [Aeromonas dhakensis]|uniref:class I SAM-dependent methyltransferase n=1 Tax=Aeromonas dhakensis TaxID=196024 RepID=UPI001FCA7E39|nr:class I SAM-dependent methyltransferase [Aeromonas dhakensis]MCJ2369027.1 class I SAM-dependent methyltransferase [Aeromonas dhakensis]
MNESLISHVPQAKTAMTILQLLLKIAERHKREYDKNQVQLLEKFIDFEQEKYPYHEFLNTWDKLTATLFSAPHWFSLLMDDMDNELSKCIRLFCNKKWLPDLSGQDDYLAWNNKIESVEYRNLKVIPLLRQMAEGELTNANALLRLRQFYLFKDLLTVFFINPEYIPLHNDIFSICAQQLKNWNFSYVSGYPYQGLEKIGIAGAKPTEERLRRYRIETYLSPNDDILDIGSNNGFFSMEIAKRTKSVDAIEFNPYLNLIAERARQELGVNNIRFHQLDFCEYETNKVYQAIFSLANHCTIDGNLSINFVEYIAKCFSLLDIGGYLFFESHNVFGPGTGSVGDDGDINAKFDVVEQYFEVIDFYMTRKFVPLIDIDKLFVILKRRSAHQPTAPRTLDLERAKQVYY